MFHTRFRLILVKQLHLQRRRFLENDQPETRIVYGDHVCKQIGMKWAIFIEDVLP